MQTIHDEIKDIEVGIDYHEGIIQHQMAQRNGSLVITLLANNERREKEQKISFSFRSVTYSQFEVFVSE